MCVFTVLVMVSHSTCVLAVLQHMCVLVMVTMSMCCHGLLQHDCAAGEGSCISLVALCHPKYVCNEFDYQ